MSDGLLPSRKIRVWIESTSETPLRRQGKSGECEADSRHAKAQVTLLLADCILNLIIRILPHE
jgi:hypothetical protein